MTERGLRVLVVSHAWEGTSKGGAERAASALTDALNGCDHVEARLVACIPDAGVVHTNSPMGMDEHGTILIRSQTDWDFFSWTSPDMAGRWIDLLDAFQPDVVHLHHYAQAGIELPSLVKSWRPETRVVVTLHEFLAICPQGGQMIHRNGSLCSSFGARRCSSCKEWSLDYWAAREAYVRLGLSQVDEFIAPSEFLRERYIRWGIEPDRIWRVPNVTRSSDMRQLPVATSHPRPVTRVVFLSQHTPNKGVETLLEAALLVKKRKSAPGLQIDLYGGGAERFGGVFASRLADLVAKTKGVVTARGAFDNDDLDTILDGADFVVVPSTWWENSPVVIQEAFERGIPVIASRLGGMAEQIDDGVNGVLFRAGDVEALAEALIHVAESHTWDVQRPPTPVEVAQQHVAVYSLSAETPSRGVRP